MTGRGSKREEGGRREGEGKGGWEVTFRGRGLHMLRLMCLLASCSVYLNVCSVRQATAFFNIRQHSLVGRIQAECVSSL
jgi:hypothetical protein